MHFVVCVKQTPKTESVKIDKNGCLMRETCQNAINPFDEFALEEAVKLKELVGGEVSALTMGPASAIDVLRECISRGADNAYHLSDRAFAGSDTYGTSYILSQAIKKINAIKHVDMVLCGKQTNDSDTGHVAAQISAWLGWPFVSFVKKAGFVENKILVERLMEDGTDILEVPVPCVMSVLKEINDPRVPSVGGRIKAKKAGVTVWNASDIDAEGGDIGLAHSHSRVVGTFAPERENISQKVEGSTPAAKAKNILKILKD